MTEIRQLNEIRGKLKERNKQISRRYARPVIHYFLLAIYVWLKI